VPKEQGQGVVSKRGDADASGDAATPVKPKNTLMRVSTASKARAERYGHAMNFLKGLIFKRVKAFVEQSKTQRLIQ